MNWGRGVGGALGAIGVAALLSACSIDGGELVRSGEPTGVIQVENQANSPLTAVLISDCNNFTYGFNRLGDGSSIGIGEVASFTVSAGCWDVNVGYGWGTGYAEAKHRFNVPANGVVRYVVNE